MIGRDSRLVIGLANRHVAFYIVTCTAIQVSVVYMEDTQKDREIVTILSNFHPISQVNNNETNYL